MSRTERPAAKRCSLLLRAGPALGLLLLVSFAFNWYHLGGRVAWARAARRSS